MAYFARIFTASTDIPSLHDMRVLVAQYGATIAEQEAEEFWDTAEILYDEDEQPIELERYQPATDGLFEEDVNTYRHAVAGFEGPAAERVLRALDECRQVICFRVPDDADDTVWGPLNAAMDAITHSIGGLAHAENEGFYDGTELILPME